jgi:hypothetical protein
MLADEENSSDATNNYANLAGSQVYNNVLAGCRIGIRDYSEGDAHAVLYHGLRNTLIANNTIVMPFAPLATADVMGVFLQDNTTPSGVNRNSNSVIANNIVIGYNTDPLIWSELAGPLGGITLTHNLYFSPAATPFRAGNSAVMDLSLAGWQALLGSGNEAGSLFRDPQLVNAALFRGPRPAPYDVRNADLGAASPARNAGVAQTVYTVNFAGAARAGWNVGAY